MYSTCSYAQFEARRLVIIVRGSLQGNGIGCAESYGKDYYKVTDFHSGWYLSLVHKFALQAFLNFP
jgi:hypothetical protein